MSLIIDRATDVTEVDDVELRLERFFDERETEAVSHGRQYLALWREARRAAEGGKKLRPALVVGTYRAFGGTRAADAVQLATAFELLHTAFLLHDDVIDRDTMRRGRPNLAGAFASEAAERGVSAADATRWGQASAILAGDLLIHAAQAMVARLGIEESRRIELLDLFESCVFVTAAGELGDVAYSLGIEKPELPEVLAMAESKTANYSFAGPLRAGAILAGADARTQNSLGEFGRLVGIAFQLRDDVLGVFGTERVTGKSANSDLREGKLTSLMLYGLDTSDGAALRVLMSGPNPTDDDCRAMRWLLERCGARAYVGSLIADHVDRALDTLAAANLPDALASELQDVARRAYDRVR